MSHLVAVLVRTVVLAVVVGLYYLALPYLFPPTPGDADIGAGLVGFAVLALAAGTGGVVDGRRHPVGRVVLTWLAVGALLGAGWSVALTGVAAGADAATVLRDVVSFVPFAAILVTAPAALGAVVGRGLSPQPR